MGCLYFNANTVNNFKVATKSDTEKFALFFGELLDKGIYIAPSQYEAMFISDAHSPDDLNTALKVVSGILIDLF